ncbi:MAG: T9SS C-terminal target domain-containing protein [Chitinophagaceae bacterium]|nr:MAG: T9SS C-terminal target domain-containing protein [Chitinophagaceae bacterium]
MCAPAVSNANITLDFFQGFLKSSNDVVLDWVTVNETDADFFTVEKSNDGINFQHFATVQAANNNALRNHYRLNDNSPNTSSTYYRLSHTDIFGVTEVFNVVIIGQTVSQQNNNLAYNPNNVSNTQSKKISLFGKTFEDKSVKIYDAKTGQFIQEVVPGTTDNDIVLQNNLSDGKYLIRIENNTGVETRSLNVNK